MNLQEEPPEEKMKKKTKPSSPPSSSSPSFSSLPDEIIVNCLARISRPYYPTLSVVSKTFHSLLSSAELYAARSHLRSTEQCLYVCLWDKSYQFPKWFTLWINPNRTLPNSMKKKTTEQLLVPITSSNFPSVSQSTIVVGSDIYVIGGPVIDYEPSAAVRVLDCRSQTWRDAPSMNVARRNALACVHDGKIYAMAGCRGKEEESWAEVFDTKTQTWEQISIPNTEVCKSFLYRIAEIQGKIHLQLQYYYHNSIKKYAYDPKQGKWESCNGVVTFPKSDCVMDGVSYMMNDMRRGGFDLLWSTEGNWERVKGLESLGDKYMRNGDSTCNRNKLVSCGGKLYLIWEGCKKHNPNNVKKIWCAEIVVEKRDGGEVWGNVEWVDVVHSVPTSCGILHCLAVSV